MSGVGLQLVYHELTECCFVVHRMTVFVIAFYFPLFYLQLDALTHGLSQTFSFYSVRYLFLLLLSYSPLIV